MNPQFRSPDLHFQPSGTMVGERRNFGLRAETMRRVLDAIRASAEGIPVEDGHRDGALGRILRRLAVRGLVRVRDGRWLPDPVLFAAPRLREDAAA